MIVFGHLEHVGMSALRGRFVLLETLLETAEPSRAEHDGADRREKERPQYSYRQRLHVSHPTTARAQNVGTRETNVSDHR